MIRKLKIKFIFINMLFVFIIMTSTFVIMYINTGSDLENSSINAMHELAMEKPEFHHSPFEPDRPRRNDYSHLTTYSIHFDKSQNSYHLEGFGDIENLTENDAQNLDFIINKIKNSSEREGLLDEYDLRYFITDTPDGERIILLDRRYETDSLRRLAISYLGAFAIAFVLFFVISVILANIAIKPVEESMTKQSQFISDVSHELKTPITIITTNTDIVLSHEESTVKEEQKWLGYIKDEAQRMCTLVNMMLFLAKTDEAHVKPEAKDFDLSNSMYEVSLPFESVCYENSKNFNIDIEPNIFIKADEASIKQLIVILIDNAIKYSNENGDIKVVLKKSNEKAIISVFNTGEFIPKDKINLLFDRFYRIEESRNRAKGGSGLGLSIAKRIVEENNGSITVLSEKEVGNTFKCTFDLHKHKKQSSNNTK